MGKARVQNSPARRWRSQAPNFGGDFHDAGQDEGHDADVFGVAAARRLEPGGNAGALVSLALGNGAVASKHQHPTSRETPGPKHQFPTGIVFDV